MSYNQCGYAPSPDIREKMRQINDLRALEDDLRQKRQAIEEEVRQQMRERSFY